jgi:Holliday junction resolvasome RuvABC endonuclease subunit
MIIVADQHAEIVVGVETAYLGQNPNVFLGLIQCQSNLGAATLDAGHTFKYITPMDSFRAATGLTQYPLNEKGSRSGTRKPAIQKALREKYDLGPETSEHIFDALAIAEAVKQKSISQ